VRLQAIELRKIRLPMVSAFRSSTHALTARDVLIVRVESTCGEGWGECVAGAEPLYSSEYIDAAWRMISDYLAPELLAVGELDPADVGPRLARFKGHPMAKAALEMAALDAALRSRGVSLATYLGGVLSEVTPGVAVGILSCTGELLECVARHLEAGYRRVKLKVEPGWDIEPVQAVREHFGPELMMQVDANGAYRRDDFEHLALLDEFSLLLIEQPLDEQDLLGHAELARRISTPVCLDESIVSAHGAATVISMGACSIVNIKAGRVGGYLEARRVHDVCLSHKVPVWCGGMLETGLGRAANLALASLPGFTLPGDISATDRYLSQDITPPLKLRGGTIAVPKGPGIGVEVQRSVVEALTTRRTLIRRTAS